MKDTQNTNYIFTPKVSDSFLNSVYQAVKIAKEKNVTVEFEFNGGKILIDQNTDFFTPIYRKYKKVLRTELGSLAKNPLLRNTDLSSDQQKRLDFINKQFNQTSKQTLKEAIDKYYREVVNYVNQANEHENLPLIPEI